MSNSPRTVIAAITILSGLWSGRLATAHEFMSDYDALNKALTDGRDVRMVIDLSACQIHGTKTSGPAIKGSMRFDGYMIQADGTIAFAKTHFTVRSDKSPAAEFLSFRVREGGQVDAHTVILDAKTFEILRDTDFDCEMGKGATFHW